MEESLSAAWAHCQDIALDPSNFYYDSLFHRLSALVEALQTYVEGDDQVAGWFPCLEEEAPDIYQQLAHLHIDEAIANWESLEVNRLADLFLPNIP